MAKYSIKKNRIDTGYVKGFICEDNGQLLLDDSETEHCIFLRGIDGARQGAQWGRLHFNVDRAEDRLFSIYVMAFDSKVQTIDRVSVNLDTYLTSPDISNHHKRQYLMSVGASRFIGKSDILLYDLSGQYLYIAMLVAGEGNLTISDIFLDSVGDNFMATYPEVYRERNSFFHRYISVFSSIYNDYEKEIEELPKLLDIDTCPEELLTVYGSWMGIDLEGGSLSESVKRQFVKEAYSLNRMKGTKYAINRVLEIILGKQAIIIEHNQLRSMIKEGKVYIPEGLKTQGVYDVTVMVPGVLTESLRHQIVFMLNQFKPIRTRINIMQMDENPTADSGTYLDINTRLPVEKGAELDGGLSLDSAIVLE